MPQGIYERTAEHNANLSAALRGLPKRPLYNEAHSHWRGEDATYSSKHKWVRRHKGRAAEQACLHCERSAAAWANVSREYRRDLDDYIPLCWSCHAKFDGYPHGWSMPKETQGTELI